MKPRVGITIGDPAGIGPEVVLKALARAEVRRVCRPVVFGDVRLLGSVSRAVLRRSSLPLADYVDLISIPLEKFRAGVASVAAGKSSGIFISAAVRAARAGALDAIVTAPINKESFRMGGWGAKFTGHTEMLAALTGAKSVALMLVHGDLRASHVTSHIPLKDVPAAVTSPRVLETILVTNDALRKMGFRKPRIAVCGLNPHAGDGGILGDEEKRVIAPAVRRARAKSVDVHGPLSPDTVWPLVRDRVYDAGVAMYHEQGQIPVKLLSFQSKRDRVRVRGVNVTLGLPIIRTSVAHGTAYEIAGMGKASEQSMVDAILLAARMARK